MTTHILTPEQIAEGRQKAALEYEAKMAYFAAAERLARVLDGTPIPTPPDKPEKKTAYRLPASREEVGDLPLKLKTWILLSIHWGARFPTAIVDSLRSVGAVNADYPASHISPKLNAYREGDLVTSGANGWMLTDKGQLEISRDISSKKGAAHVG